MGCHEFVISCLQKPNTANAAKDDGRLVSVIGLIALGVLVNQAHVARTLSANHVPALASLRTIGKLGR